MTDHHDSGHDEHSHGSTGKFLTVFVALLFLTAISFTVGNNEAIMSTPSIGWTIMMAVSCAKAMLVMLFFMHLKWEAHWKYVLTIPASIMSVFLLLMLFPDIKNRNENYSETRWLHAATPDTQGHDTHAHAATDDPKENEPPTH
jgi:cytochrome c oxidase subunit 4